MEVTQLGYGAMEMRGNREEITESDAERVLNAVLDSGITFIDTSPDYGLSEERIGKYISHPDCHTTIVGTADQDHLRANVAAAQAGPLPAEIYAEAARRLEAIGESPLKAG